MHIEHIESDIVLFRGDAYESLATVFLHRGHALMIDALADANDAQIMRRHIEDNLDARVDLVVMTHYMNDHMAALRLLPTAQIVAHQHYMHTYLSQRMRTVEDDIQFVAPTITFTGSFKFQWGRHALEVFHNPGKTMCAVAIDVPDCDLMLCGDAIVGHAAYLGMSAPEVIDEAIVRLQRRRRGRIIPGHIGVLPGRAFGDARRYLHRLGKVVLKARLEDPSEGKIRDIRIEDCLPADIRPTSFERFWHDRNLDRIIERRLFAFDIHRPVPAAQPA
jgi:cyclase